VHAVLITVTINDQSAARSQLDGLVPQVSGMPGFVAVTSTFTAPLIGRLSNPEFADGLRELLGD
jgi:hypothetical protein